MSHAQLQKRYYQESERILKGFYKEFDKASKGILEELHRCSRVNFLRIPEGFYGISLWISTGTLYEFKWNSIGILQ